jgi:RecB family endonuclease NucS
MRVVSSVSITCDFPTCGATFHDVSQWREHYVSHLGSSRVSGLESKDTTSDVIKEVLKERSRPIEQPTRLEKEIRAPTSWKNEREMVDFYCKHPGLIEDGFKPIFREFGAAGVDGVRRGGRMDIFGIDKEGNLCVVEFKKDDFRKKRDYPERQVYNYRLILERLIKALGLERNLKVRGIVITPKKKEEIVATPRPWTLEEIMTIGRR